MEFLCSTSRPDQQPRYCCRSPCVGLLLSWPTFSSSSASPQVLSLQHNGSKDSAQSQFASYWKPILSMDANFWQRWLHMHRITVILEHDM